MIKETTAILLFLECDENDLSEDESWRSTWVVPSTLRKENTYKQDVISAPPFSIKKFSAPREVISSTITSDTISINPKPFTTACKSLKSISNCLANKLLNTNESGTFEQTTANAATFHSVYSVHNFNSRVVLSPVSSTFTSLSSVSTSSCSAKMSPMFIDDSDDKKKTFKEKVFLCKKMKRKLKIKYLVGQLEKKERQIKRLAEMDISLKEMESEESIYIQEGRLKEEFLKLWRRYCKLIGQNPDSVLNNKKKVRVTSAPFPELNRSVERFVNKHGVFPNLLDIKQVCKKAIAKDDINIRESDLHNIAVDIFTEVGKKLQNNRRKEFNEISGNYLTDRVKIEEDPALEDDTLIRKLKQNRKLAKRRIENVFQDFVRQQYEQQTLGTTIETICKTDDEESDEHNSIFKNSSLKSYSLNTFFTDKTIKIDQKPNNCHEQTIIRVTVSNKEPLISKNIGVTIGNSTSEIIEINNTSSTFTEKPAEHFLAENSKQIKRVKDIHINAFCDRDFSSSNELNPLSSNHPTSTMSITGVCSQLQNKKLFSDNFSFDNSVLKIKRIPKLVVKDRVKLLKDRLSVSLERSLQNSKCSSNLAKHPDCNKLCNSSISNENELFFGSKPAVVILSSDNDSD